MLRQIGTRHTLCRKLVLLETAALTLIPLGYFVALLVDHSISNLTQDVLAPLVHCEVRGGAYQACVGECVSLHRVNAIDTRSERVLNACVVKPLKAEIQPADAAAPFTTFPKDVHVLKCK